MARGIDVGEERLVVPASLSASVDVLLRRAARLVLQPPSRRPPARDATGGRVAEGTAPTPGRHRRREACRPRQQRGAARAAGALRCRRATCASRRPGGPPTRGRQGRPAAARLQQHRGLRARRDHGRSREGPARPRRGVPPRRLPDVRLPARRGPRRSHDRSRLGRGRRLPVAPRAPFRHHPRVHGCHPADAVARLEDRADVGRELQGVGAAAGRAARRHRRVRVVPHQRPLPRDRFADRHPRPLGTRPVRHGDARGSRDRRAGEAGGGAGVHLRPDVARPGPGLPLRPRPGRRTTHGRVVPVVTAPAALLG